MAKYEDRGVSPHKIDVHNAISQIDPGLFPGAFCKAIPDVYTDPTKYCFLLHADGAGTKSSLAYIYYKENRNHEIFEGIAQDSIVMNLDDLLCVGATGPFILSNTIGRNSNVINGNIVSAIIHGYSKFAEMLNEYGIVIIECGGETADSGDIIRTVVVDSVLAVRMRKEDFIDASKVQAGQDIIGLASYGKAVYESKYNSGIGTNGFTAARHEILNEEYKEEFPETFNPDILNLAYTGKFRIDANVPNLDISLGEALLSPTRTYAPILIPILEKYRKQISAIFHNTGGGQTKCLRFGTRIHYIKDNLFPLPPIFKFIKDNSDITDYEMYRIFNMGHRLEIICDPEVSMEIINISETFDVEAKIIGKTKSSKERNMLTIFTPSKEINYSGECL